MSLQLVALLIVTIGFTTLFSWVYWPTNRERFDAGSRLPFIDSPKDPVEIRSQQERPAQ